MRRTSSPTPISRRTSPSPLGRIGSTWSPATRTVASHEPEGAPGADGHRRPRGRAVPRSHAAAAPDHGELGPADRLAPPALATARLGSLAGCPALRGGRRGGGGEGAVGSPRPPPPASWGGGAGKPRRVRPPPRSPPPPGPGVVLTPPLELLNPAPPEDGDAQLVQIDQMGQKLIETLQTFRVEGAIAGRTVGPVVTQYEVAPGPGVKVGRIASRADARALAMRGPSLRIVAPIPGKAAVGIEVPNPIARMVHVR